MKYVAVAAILLAGGCSGIHTDFSWPDGDSPGLEPMRPVPDLHQAFGVDACPPDTSPGELRSSSIQDCVVALDDRSLNTPPVDGSTYFPPTPAWDLPRSLQDSWLPRGSQNPSGHVSRAMPHSMEH